MKVPVSLLAALFLSATAARADILAEAVAALQNQGYTNIEVKQSATRLKLEAQKGDVQIEQVIDRTTGSVLKEERSDIASGGPDGADDATDDGAGHDLGDDNDGNDGSGAGDDNDSHEAGDDHGSHDGGDDHESGDDHDGGDHGGQGGDD